MKLGILLVPIVTILVASSEASEREYIGEWAVQVQGGEEIARRVAEDNGFQFDRRIGTLEDIYRFVKENHKRSTRAATAVHTALLEDKRVLWAEQQHIRNHERREGKVVKPDATGDDYVLSFNDPLYPKQWYLHNDGQNGGTSGMDMNVMPVWKLGYTGKGIHVVIVDDGVDGTHADLVQNFDINASYDFNNRSNGIHDQDPHPDDSIAKGNENAHGTRCAGEVAAAADNGICGVGIAYEAKIGGMRILDGSVTDALEAEALLYNNDYIDIYSCCWGPPDKGKDFILPHTLTTQAMIRGVKEGRNGKGSIFVWASGNGGNNDDDCNADGYVSRPETISIGSVNDEGLTVYFTEECSSTMAVTLSGGPSGSQYSTTSERRAALGINLVVTTDLHGQCTTSFVGTSSAAPLASGLFALVLQANPNLTWRDLQHIIAHGCFIPSPMEEGWHINGAGFHLNHKVGFGVLDAGKMVELALQWEPVGERRECVIQNQRIDLSVEQGHKRRTKMTVSHCQHVNKLEHTIVNITLQAPRRGDISIKLFSPYGTPSELISTRKFDDSKEGLDDWPFMTVHNWGESPEGEWTLEITYHQTPEHIGKPSKVIPRDKCIATITHWGFTFYGTGEGSTEEPVGDVGEGRVFKDNAGKGDAETILKVYNSEQKTDEEIHVDIENVAEGLDLPPNADNNRDGDQIDTNYFDAGQPIQTKGEVYEALEYKREEGTLEEFLRGLDPDTLHNLYSMVERDLADTEAAFDKEIQSDTRSLLALIQKRKESTAGAKENDLLQRRKTARKRAEALKEVLRDLHE